MKNFAVLVELTDKQFNTLRRLLPMKYSKVWSTYLTEKEFKCMKLMNGLGLVNWHTDDEYSKPTTYFKYTNIGIEVMFGIEKPE